MSRAEELEAQRILRIYKRLVLLGRARLALADGRALVGPDCAYHLYNRSRTEPRRRGRARRRTRLES